MYSSAFKTKILLFIVIFILISILNGNPLFSEDINPNKEFAKFNYIENKKRADEYYRKGLYPDALFLYTRLNLYSTKTNNHAEEIDTLLNIGFIYWNLGKINDSLNTFTSSKELSDKYSILQKSIISNNAIKICNQYLKGKQTRYDGDRQKSIDCFNIAIEISSKEGLQNFIAKCLRQMSISYWELGNFKMFFSLNEKAFKIALEMNQRREQCMSLINIGIYYRKINDYSKSLNHYEKALELSINLDNQYNVSACLNNIGNIYKDIGNFIKSINYLKQALQIDRQLGNKKNISIDLNNLGETLRSAYHSSNDLAHLNKALEYFFECLNISQEINNQIINVRVLNNIGTVKADMKDYYEALKYFEKAFNNANLINDKETMGMALNNKGIVYYHLGDYENSTRCYQRAIDLALRIEGNHILWEAYLEIAKTLQKQKNYLGALSNYKNSISVIEDIRSNIKLENHKASYFGTNKRIEAYHNVIHLLVNLYQNSKNFKYKSDAFSYMERAKARAFLDRIELSQIDISQGVNLRLLNREKEIMKDISKLHTSNLNANDESEFSDALQFQLKELENKLESLRLEIRTQSPSYANLKYPEIINLETTQSKFGRRGIAIFEYIVGKEQSYAFVITKKDIKVFPLPNKDEITSKIKSYLKCITDRECNDFRIGLELYSILLKPGLDKKIKNIIFIPDDILHYLPFEALIEEGTNKWLIEKYKVSYAPSISSLREIINRKKRKKGPNPKKDLLAIGDPKFSLFDKSKESLAFLTEFTNEQLHLNKLKYSSIEIEKIRSIFRNSKSDSLIGKNASEGKFKNKSLIDYKIIHFATHSIINDNNPERSSIILGLDDNFPEDGILQMREIYNLKFNSNLVTLSACQTGLGQLIKGEGIEGLNRAFFYSGTASVLMSLWSINDQATFQLMERFYFYLHKSYPIKDALRKAKRDFIESDSLTHPFFWAGFIVSGDAHNNIFSLLLFKHLLFGIGLIFISILLFVLIRKI